MTLVIVLTVWALLALWAGVAQARHWHQHPEQWEEDEGDGWFDW